MPGYCRAKPTDSEGNCDGRSVAELLKQIIHAELPEAIRQCGSGKSRVSGLYEDFVSDEVLVELMQ